MLKKIAETIGKADNIAILPHASADGDAIGSCLALAVVLSGMGKRVSVLMEESIPQTYNFLPAAELAVVYGGENYEYDLAVALDCGDIDRLGSRKEVFENAPVTVNIDHHATNTGFAQFDHVDTSASATGEIIFDLIRHMGAKPGRDASTCLYTAIASDTGGFRYANTTPASLAACSRLIEEGADAAFISKKIFETVSLSKVKLTGEAINSLELYENGRIAVMTLTAQAIKRAGASEDESEGIINTARNIIGVETAVLIKELENGNIKVSLRSNEYVDVSEIARKYSGGGHKRAAGFTAKGGELGKIVSSLLQDIKEML